MMAADSWHQPDSMEQKLCTMRKESNKTSEGKLTEQYVHKYLQNNIEKVSIHILNDDCLRHIFQFLPIKDRIRIERVCKRWRDLNQPSWYPTGKTLYISPSIIGTKYYDINNRALHKILLKCGKSLTRINLSNNFCNKVKSTLAIIGKLCPNLANIDISQSMVCASGIRKLANNCKNITQFKLGPSINNCDDELEYLFMLNKNLEYLEIKDNDILGKCLLSLPEQTVQTIILNICEELEENYLSMALKKLGNLKHLAIYACNITEHTLETIGQHCRNLKTLKLYDFGFIKTDIFYYNLYHLVNLQILTISFSGGVSDDFLIGLVRHCSRNVSDAGLTAIATLARLEKLNVSKIYKITDDSLKNLCDLKEFKCQDCKFTDRGIITLIKSSPQLQLLYLLGCKNITNTVLDFAIDVCRSRTNNLMLEMFVWESGILKEKIDQEKLPPLLRIINSWYESTMNETL